MAKRRIQVHVGTAEDMGRRFVDAWRRAERGEREDGHVMAPYETILADMSLTP